jgi:hypothetical protein
MSAGPLALCRLNLLALTMMSEVKDICETNALARGAATLSSVRAPARLARASRLTSTIEQRASAQPGK